MKWKKKNVSMVVPGKRIVISEVGDPVVESSLLELLEERVREYQKEVLESLLRPSFFSKLLTKRRYMERSKPRPHEFGVRDAKSVLRQIRKGRAVSPQLLSRAVKTLVDEAGYDRD